MSCHVEPHINQSRSTSRTDRQRALLILQHICRTASKKNIVRDGQVSSEQLLAYAADLAPKSPGTIVWPESDHPIFALRCFTARLLLPNPESGVLLWFRSVCPS